jgi:orotidine-5'-phosphate decarboxylase
MLLPRDRLIVALDLPAVRAAEALVERLDDSVRFYKIGYQLVFAGGLPLAAALVRAGKRVFLDMKLHDIANTVASGVASVAQMDVTFLTVHAYPATLRAAIAAKAGSSLKILAVSVLTSFDDADLADAGYEMGVEALVTRRAAQARDLGADGIVCAGSEVAALRPIAGPDMALVIPGIRPAGAPAGDQKRAVTPGQAMAAGADYLVVGRPVVAAADPVAAAEAIVAEIAAARHA